MGLEEALVEGSSIFIHAREKAVQQAEARGLANGLANGLARGSAEEARRLLKLAIARRFPGLEDSPEIDKIGNLNDLESLLLDHAFRADSRESMVQAIREAASKA
jgi:hypothetical protein